MIPIIEITVGPTVCETNIRGPFRRRYILTELWWNKQQKVFLWGNMIYITISAEGAYGI